ncbi:MAG: polymerase [Sphingobacteriaceae bacterium]
MRNFFLLIFTSLFLQSVMAQPKFIRKLLLEKDSSRKANFIALPGFGYAQETGFEFGASALYSFYADTLTLETRLSNLYAAASYTTKGQRRIGIRADYWLPKNRYHLTASMGYSDFPFSFYGTGNRTAALNKDLLTQKRLYLNLSAEKLLTKHLYGALNLNLGNYHYLDKVADGIFENDADIAGKGGGNAIFYGPGIIYDTRNLNTYTTAGIYVNMNAGLASTPAYHGTYFNLDARQFNPLTKNLVLAFQLQYQAISGNEVPFFLLQRFGNDEIMRGYYNGRYRDKNLTALQTELRYRLNDRLAVVGFGGTGTVFQNDFKLRELKPNYGGGFRYFFDVEKGLGVRLDYGIGEKRKNEERQKGFYISFSEAF